MVTKLPAKPLRTLPNPAPPPPHLEPPEANLWAALLTDFSFVDPASLALLEEALSAHQRARRCREMIDRDGETVLDKWKQVKPHPLLPAERDARAAFLSAMKMSNLDIGDAR